MISSSINDLLQSLKDEFLDSLPERISEIESLILNLPDNPDVENLLRVVHSLKGSAGTHGFHIFTKISHQMEDMMRELIDSDRIHTQSAVDVLLDYNDLQNTAIEIIKKNSDNLNIIDKKLIQISSAIDGDHLKVLIVEPSPIYAAMIESVLHENNCHTKVVTDGLVALENLLMQSYDIVITAMEIPTLNGDALISALRVSQGKNRDINAILITSKNINDIKNSKLFNHVVNRNVIKDGILPSLLT